MPIVTLSERGQLVIPHDIREKLDLRRGKKLLLKFSEAQKTITLRPIAAGQGRGLRGILRGTRALEMLEAEHKRELESDDRRRR